MLNFSKVRLDPRFRTGIEVELDRSSRSEKFAFYCVIFNCQAVKIGVQKLRSEKVAAKIFCGVVTLPPRKALPVAHAKRGWQKGASLCVTPRLYKADCPIYTTLELRPNFGLSCHTLSRVSLMPGLSHLLGREHRPASHDRPRVWLTCLKFAPSRT